MRRVFVIVLALTCSAVITGSAEASLPAEINAGRTTAPAVALREDIARGEVTPASWMNLLREAFDSHEDAASRMIPLGGELPEGCDERYQCPAIWPFKAGDLDGDGSDDILTTEQVDGKWSLRGRRGLDGSPLWSAQIKISSYGYAFFGRADVAGDSTPEIVLLEARSPYVGVYEDIGGASIVELQQVVRVLDAGTGEEIWRRRYDGSLIVAGAWGVGSFVAEGRDLIIDLLVMDDASGDGVADLLVQRASWQRASVLGLGVSEIRSAVDIVDGSSGETFRSLELPIDTSVPLVHASGDLSGDGAADLVVVDSQMSAYSGRSGERLWEVSISDLGRYPHPTPVRFNGGSLWDIALETERPDLGFLPVVTAFRGRDGQRMWSHVGLRRYNRLELAGDVDGDGATDLVEAGTSGFFSGEGGQRVIVTSGASGVRILDEHLIADLEEGHHAAYRDCYWCVADLTGDGIAEVTLSWAEYVREDETSQLVAIHTRTLSLRDGSVLWQRRHLDFSSLRTIHADLNGNNTDDLIDVGEPAVIHEGSTGEPIATLELMHNGYIVLGATIDGTPGDELVVSFQQYDPETQTFTIEGIQVVNTNGTLWSLSAN